jgi:hypothetical protein
MPGVRDFRTELRARFRRAEYRGAANIEVNAGELHRSIGGYPGYSHNMPQCCEAMYGEKRVEDEIIASPPKGKGASLTIRYVLPRQAHAQRS